MCRLEKTIQPLPLLYIHYLYHIFLTPQPILTYHFYLYRTNWSTTLITILNILNSALLRIGHHLLNDTLTTLSGYLQPMNGYLQPRPRIIRCATVLLSLVRVHGTHPLELGGRLRLCL